jgi:hypothetical protein
MWILAAEGDTLKGFVSASGISGLITGKKYWLRPGQEYALGRNPRERSW